MLRLYEEQLWRLATEVLGGERAQYGSQLLEQPGQQLSQEFGRGFEARNLRRMVKFAQTFSIAEILSTLSTKLHTADIACRKRMDSMLRSLCRPKPERSPHA